MKAPTQLKVRMFNSIVAPEWATHVLRIGSGPTAVYFWEEGTTQENGKRFQTVRASSYVDHYEAFTNRGGELVYELPPLPQEPTIPDVADEVMYFNHRGSRSCVLKLEQTTISVRTNASALRVRMTPETARDMAADLMRMAVKLEQRLEESA